MTIDLKALAKGKKFSEIEKLPRPRIQELLNRTPGTTLALAHMGATADRELVRANTSRAKADDLEMDMEGLKRQAEDIEQSSAVQKRFIVDQQNEKKRINARFDEELVTLRKLWSLALPAAAASGGTSAKR